MSQTTLYRRESATNTTHLGSHVFQFGTNAPWAQTDQFAVPFTVEFTPESRSSRSGRLPRAQERAQRESADPAYKQRMENARRRMSAAAYDDNVESIAKLRLANGMSQTQLASAMGTSQSHIAKIEAGHVRLYLDTAERLARTLGVTIDRLNALIVRPEINTQAWGS